MLSLRVSNVVKQLKRVPRTATNSEFTPAWPGCRSFTYLSALRAPEESSQSVKPLQSILQTDPSSVLPRRRKQAMTTREISAFNDMFNMIFDSVSDKKDVNDVELRDELGDLFTRLRRNSKRLRWTTEEENDLDKKKEEMELCNTDQQLLTWAMENVFAESVQLEAESRKAIEEAERSGQLQDLPKLQSSAYPHLLALLMKTFRDRYNDPHLALAMFDHARNLSVVSYVFGCTTMAYNEMIQTRWACFRDLKGVHDALQEMTTNGVKLDSRTRKIADDIRREAGSRNMWTEEDPLGGGEVWNLLNGIEKMTTKKRGKVDSADARREGPKWDDWKTEAMEDRDSDVFGFGKWDEPTRQEQRRYR